MRNRAVRLAVPLALPLKLSLALLLGLLLAVSCAARARGPMKLVFDGTRAGGDPKSLQIIVTVRSDEGATVIAEGFEVRLDLVKGEERKRFVTAALGKDIDPFEILDRRQEEADRQAAQPGKKRIRGFSLITVLMEVLNKSEGTLDFNPQNIILVTDKLDFIEPLDATRAYELFRAAGMEPDEFMSNLHRAVYDTSPSVRPGESISRLLAYTRPRPETKKAYLDFSFFSIDTEAFSFRVPMRQIELPAAPSGPTR